MRFIVLLILCIAIAALREYGYLRVGAVVEEAEQVPAAPVQSSDPRAAWAIDLLAALGNTRPSPDTVAFVVEWTRAEDTSMGAFERNNPLNTTQQGFSENSTINSDGVKGYATREAGIAATVQTLSYGYYTEIVAGLQTNDSERAYRGLIASPWASSHYNGGWR